MDGNSPLYAQITVNGVRYELALKKHLFLSKQLKTADILLKDLAYEFITAFEFNIRT